MGNDSEKQQRRSQENGVEDLERKQVFLATN